jgi:hypothetical protein
MIVNPSKQKLEAFEGTHLLQNDFGLTGAVLYDPEEPGRTWRISALYLPLNRHLGGIRAKCQDSKGFVSFINQRDLELLLGLGKPGQWCGWLGDEYPELGRGKWTGFCMDSEDIADDLYDKELVIRGEVFECTGQQLAIPEGTEVEQWIHYNVNNDAVRRCFLRWDMDSQTGLSPDPRLETLMNRWVPYEVEKVRWERL